MLNNFNPFTTEARFYVLNAMAFSTEKRASVVKGSIDPEKNIMST